MSGATRADPTIVDFGAHLYPDSVFPDVLYENNPLADLLGDSMRDLQVLLDRFTAGGIDVAVLSQPYYMGHDDDAETAEANDALLDIVQDSDRLFGLAALPVPAGGDVTAEEFERCLENGYSGGAIETKSAGIEPNDPELWSVYEVATDYDAPLLIHPKLDATLHPDALDDSYVLNAVFGREAGLSTAICKMIHDGVLDRFPDLKIVVHHYGGNIASMMGRLHLTLDEGRWPDRQGQVKSYREFREAFEQFHIDTCGFFGHHMPLVAAMEELPTARILFATDYPFEGRNAEELERYVSTVAEHTSETDAERILGGNALDLLANT